MEQKQADQLIMLNSSKFSPEYIETIREQLLNMDYTQAAMLFSDLKDPTTMMIISVVGGGLGIDRFMIGDTGLGIGKLITFIITWFFTCGMLCWVWWLVDLFLIQEATRRKNTEKVLQLLG